MALRHVEVFKDRIRNDRKFIPKTIQKPRKNEAKTVPRGLQNSYPPGLFSGLGRQDAPRGPKTAQDSPKRAPRRPKMAPRRPQDAPRQPQDVPKTAQDALKTRPRRSRRSQSRPKTAQDGPRWPQDASRWSQDGLKWPKTGQDAKVYQSKGGAFKAGVGGGVNPSPREERKWFVTSTLI